MEIAVYNINGKKTEKSIALNDSIFNIEPNNHAIYLDVKHYLANQRQGNSQCKDKGEVSRTTKKFKKQKGTGGARIGSLKSPLVKGGGTAFGPKPRDYDFKLNKKLKKIARISALTLKAKNNGLIILEDFIFDEIKTKNYIEIMKNLNVYDKKTILVVSDTNKNVYLSSRNLEKSKVVEALNINTYDIIDTEQLIISESSLAVLDNLLS